MYEWRQRDLEGRLELFRRRLQRDYPVHAPPHIYKGRGRFYLTVACYEHACCLGSAPRRLEFADKLRKALGEEAPGTVHAWVVLPNHWHALWEGELGAALRTIRRLHSGIATQWNREDGQTGRQVFCHCADRKIRSQRHFCACVNYTHANPVKHGWVARADEWSTSSLGEWLEREGRDRLVEMWKRYPVDQFGEEWDCM